LGLAELWMSLIAAKTSSVSPSALPFFGLNYIYFFEALRLDGNTFFLLQPELISTLLLELFK